MGVRVLGDRRVFLGQVDPGHENRLEIRFISVPLVPCELHPGFIMLFDVSLDEVQYSVLVMCCFALSIDPYQIARMYKKAPGAK